MLATNLLTIGDRFDNFCHQKSGNNLNPHKSVLTNMKIQMKALTYLTKQKARLMTRIIKKGKKGMQYEKEEKIIEQLENEIVALKKINELSDAELIAVCRENIDEEAD